MPSLESGVMTNPGQHIRADVTLPTGSPYSPWLRVFPGHKGQRATAARAGAPRLMILNCKLIKTLWVLDCRRSNWTIRAEDQFPDFWKNDKAENPVLSYPAPRAIYWKTPMPEDQSRWYVTYRGWWLAPSTLWSRVRGIGVGDDRGLA